MHQDQFNYIRRLLKKIRNFYILDRFSTLLFFLMGLNMSKNVEVGEKLAIIIYTLFT